MEENVEPLASVASSSQLVGFYFESTKVSTFSGLRPLTWVCIPGTKNQLLRSVSVTMNFTPSIVSQDHAKSLWTHCRGGLPQPLVQRIFLLTLKMRSLDDVDELVRIMAEVRNHTKGGD